MSSQHTLIHVICDECGEADVLSVLEHPRDSVQVEAVSKAHHTMAEEHADESGHHVEVGVSEGSAGEVADLARGMAPSVGGASPEDFAEVAE